MSEIDLIRKLESLKNTKPNKEWVAFTKQSILNSKPCISETRVAPLWIKQFAPLTACMCLALTFGVIYSSLNNSTSSEISDNQIKEPQVNLITASLVENSEPQALEENQEEQEDVLEKEVVIAGQEPKTETIELEEEVLADTIQDETKEETVNALYKEIQRLRAEASECDNQAQYLNDEQKQNCDKIKKQLKIFDDLTK